MFASIRPSIFLLSAAVLAWPAIAAPASGQWEAVSSADGSTIEIDKARISRLKSGKTAAWTRLTLDHPVLDFENQVRYTAVQALNHYDCAKGSFSTRQRIYLLDGREMKTERVGSTPIAARPGSLDARLLDEACRPRTVGEMERTAQQAAVAATAAQEDRPRAMHAEMVSAGGAEAPRSMKVADVPAPRQRMFEMPQIDKSKVEDPFKGNAPAAPAAAAPAPAPAAKASPARGAAPTPAPVQDLSRQERERMLATSGPRKAKPKKPAEEPMPVAPPPDFSRVHWGYAGLGAPENWAKIRPDYATCGEGKRQSPIDIRGGIKVDLEPIQFDYRPTQFRVVDNGHTVQVDVGEGSSITVTGHTYQLVQFHFHRPSEERVNGKAFDMAAHLVHKDWDGNLAVIAVLMEKGAAHALIQTVWNYMPLEVGLDVSPPGVVIDLNKLLPEKREYYTYMGSLTTPPCTENVLWMVLKNPVQVSNQQIGIFARLYPHNARPVQPAHDRLIKESR
jgi:carbonic anhydrase